MKKTLLVILMTINTPLLAQYALQEIPEYGGVRELVSGHINYRENALKSVDYMINNLTPGFMRKSTKAIRLYDPVTKTHEVVAKYSIQLIEDILVQTDNKLDFSIQAQQGRGYFTIYLGKGLTAYTRDGRFRIDHENRLVTLSGNYPVYDHDGGFIYLTTDDVTVSRSGVLYAKGERVGKLKITVFKYIQQMKESFHATSGSFFVLRYPIEIDTPNDGELNYGITQGFVTQANIFRSYDGGQNRSYHQASTNAFKVMMRTLTKQQQVMIGP